MNRRGPGRVGKLIIAGGPLDHTDDPEVLDCQCTNCTTLTTDEGCLEYEEMPVEFDFSIKRMECCEDASQTTELIRVSSCEWRSDTFNCHAGVGESRWVLNIDPDWVVLKLEINVEIIVRYRIRTKFFAPICPNRLTIDLSQGFSGCYGLPCSICLRPKYAEGIVFCFNCSRGMSESWIIHFDNGQQVLEKDNRSCTFISDDFIMKIDSPYVIIESEDETWRIPRSDFDCSGVNILENNFSEVEIEPVFEVI